MYQVQVVRAATHITITSPREGDEVPQSVIVQGTASNIPPDKGLWLFTETTGISGYFPQGKAINPDPIGVSSDNWTVTARIGEITDPKGTQYVLHLALVDKNSKGRAAIEQYFADGRAGKGYNGIYPLPQGIQLVAKATVVYK